MNIYVRFFDFDTLVSDEDGVIQFLQAIPDVELTDEIVDEIKDYINSETTYPKRLKIRPHIYFILIKTTASSMEEFKANRKDSFNALKPQGLDLSSRKEIKVSMLQEENFGWYRGSLRNDVDPRSQFPSCKGSNFDFEYVGENPLG